MMVSTIDLNNCEQEPIRIPGSIQPAGALLCISEADWTILQASENAASDIGFAMEALVGKSLRELVSDSDALLLADYLRLDSGKSSAVRVRFGDADFVLEAHAQGNQFILELEPTELQSADPAAMARLLSGPVDAMEQTTDIAQLLELTVKQVQMHTGYDKVMVYKFDSEWNGEVVAEQLTGALPPYMGQRFPATDIPKQARDLYTQNWIRIIPDVSYKPVPIVPQDNPVTKAPLDLSFSVFRGVSPVHIEYLHNMQVGASMSISIIVRGQLWGLIACHNKTPKAVPHDVRATCQLLGKLLSVRLNALLEQEAARLLHQQRGVLSLVRSAIAGSESVAQGLLTAADAIMHSLEADGLVVVSDEGTLSAGETLPAAVIEQIRDWMEETRTDVFASAEVSKDLAVKLPANICGMCGVRITSPQKILLLGLRREVVQKITWGGDPTKPMESAGASMRLHPRKSFESYVQTVVGRSAPWRENEVNLLKQFGEVLTDAATQKEYRRSADALSISQERDDMVSGLAHDLKAPLIAAIKTSQALAGGRFGPVDGLPREMVKLVIESQQELLGRLESMLSVYRQEIMGISLLSKPLDLALLIDKSVRRLQFSFASKQLTPNVDAAKNVIVLGDEDAISRVIENLLSNAIKFSPNQSAVYISCRAEDDRALLTVADLGPGIAESQHGNLFTRFSNGEANKSGDSSHGLGLYLTRRIVEAHGGKVSCPNAGQAGATFEVVLPLCKEDRVDARAAG